MQENTKVLTLWKHLTKVIQEYFMEISKQLTKAIMSEVDGYLTADDKDVWQSTSEHFISLHKWKNAQNLKETRKEMKKLLAKYSVDINQKNIHHKNILLTLISRIFIRKNNLLTLIRKKYSVDINQKNILLTLIRKIFCWHYLAEYLSEKIFCWH